VSLGQTLAELDSTLGTPSRVTWPSPGREARLYKDRGISLIADSTAGVVLVLLSTPEAGDLGGIRVGDSRKLVEERFGKPTSGRAEHTAYTVGEWTLTVQLGPMTEFVYELSIGRTELYPDDFGYGVLATLKRVLYDFYHAGASAGLLAFLSVANYFLWRKYKFWIPKYVHALALLAFLVICWLNWLWIKAGGELTVRRVIIILLFPAIVYFFFVGAGGVKAAWSHHSDH
jgi:hypothetical protein